MRPGRDSGSCLSKGRKFLTVAEPVLSLHPYCCGRLFALLVSTEHTVSACDILHASNLICGVCFLWSWSFDKTSANCVLTVTWWSERISFLAQNRVAPKHKKSLKQSLKHFKFIS